METKKEEITYIMGAGASYYSMPLVANFNKRFSLFLNYTGSLIKKPEGDIFFRDASIFQAQMVSHLSFDTFFKKLFHRGHNDLIAKFKAVLLTYFLYEQLIDVQNVKEISLPKEKTHSVDPRYEALIAGLLLPVQGFNFGKKINFITWNYDLNLMYALKNFKDTGSGFFDFVNESISDGLFKVGDEISIYNINGYIYHREIENIGNCIDFSLKEILKNLVAEYNEGKDSELFVHAQKIMFAWETVPNGNINDLPTIVQLAINSIQRSKNVVLVGYSLPSYNRLYDSKLLAPKNLKNANLYIQDINADGIKEILDNDFGYYSDVNYKGLPVIRTRTDCNSFILV